MNIDTNQNHKIIFEDCSDDDDFINVEMCDKDHDHDAKSKHSISIDEVNNGVKKMKIENNDETQTIDSLEVVTKQTTRNNNTDKNESKEIIIGISAYLQHSIAKEIVKHAENNKIKTEYDTLLIETEEFQIYFPPDSIKKYEYSNYVEYLLINGDVPILKEVYKFMCYFNDKMNCNYHCLIIAIIYLQRMCKHFNLTLNKTNYRGLYIVSYITSQKIWLSTFKATKEFSVLFPTTYTKVLLRAWEKELLNAILKDAKVEPALYQSTLRLVINYSKDVIVIN